MQMNTEHNKIRVAAYCRVSTDKEEQHNSFETQCRVYTDMIAGNPDWILTGIYADEGITGTNTKRRKEFRRMIADCEAGKIDLIITKSISRFARNTLECLQYVRHLQNLGVQMLFEKEGIDTGSAFSEMLLTILAAFAQEESRSLSENLKWGIRKRFEEGIDRWTRCYGYTQTSEGNYQVVPKEAAVVQFIFQQYEQGATVKQITDTLNENNTPSPQGKNWLTSVVHRILQNEKYVGDIKLQKKYTVDHLTHKEVKNDGSIVPLHYLNDHHIPLVSRKTFERTSRIREMRCQGGRDGSGKGHSIQYPFGDMLRCPYCGTTLIQKMIRVQKASRGWLCENPECGEFVIRSDKIENAVLKAYEELDMHLMEEFLTAENSEKADELKKSFISMKKEHPLMETVEYYWLDELILKITLGKHTVNPSTLDAKPKGKKKLTEDNKNNKIADDRTVTVYWRCGLENTVSSGIEKDRDMPRNIAKLYHAYLKRRQQRAEDSIKEIESVENNPHSENP